MKNIKNKETAIKGFKAVQFVREVRDKIDNDIKGMNFEQIKDYLKKGSAEFQNQIK